MNVYINLRRCWKVNSRPATVNATSSRLRTSSKLVYFKMETVLILLSLLAIVTSRTVPSTNYIPTKEQLELIFGGGTNTEAVDTPALVANESVIKENKIKPPQKEIRNAIRESEANTVELNIKIEVDCDKKRPDKSEGDKNVKQSPGKGDPVHTRFVEDLGDTDDRVAIQADNCPKGFARFGGVCVKQDT